MKCALWRYSVPPRTRAAHTDRTEGAAARAVFLPLSEGVVVALATLIFVVLPPVLVAWLIYRLGRSHRQKTAGRGHD